MTWRKFNAIGAALSVLLWIVATKAGWVSSVVFISHVSMLAIVIAFISAWRSDVPTDKEGHDL